MRPRSWPGRSGPRGSDRVSPAGPIGGRWPPSPLRSPEPSLESRAVRPPEVNPGGQRRRARAVPAASGAWLRRGVREALSGTRYRGPSGTKALKHRQFLEEGRFYSQVPLAKVKGSLPTEIQKGKDGGYGLPQGPRHALGCHAPSRVLAQMIPARATSPGTVRFRCGLQGVRERDLRKWGNGNDGRETAGGRSTWGKGEAYQTGDWRPHPWGPGGLWPSLSEGPGHRSIPTIPSR